jgi:ADP-ribose pyrophosphatase YjhB (NUDIX family)
MDFFAHKPNLVVAAVVLIQENDSVLLVQQNIERHLWGAPGGLMENDETIEQAAIREVLEETGLNVQIKRPIAIYSEPRKNALTITFEGKIAGGDMKQTTNESRGCHYFPFSDLPELREHRLPFIKDFQRQEVNVLYRLLNDRTISKLCRLPTGIS